MTDGQDNCSELSSKELAQQITKFKSVYGGVVLFLAANQDSIATGETFGISKGECITFSSNREGSRNVFESVKNAIQRSYTEISSSGSKIQTDYFSKDEREKSFAY